MVFQNLPHHNRHPHHSLCLRPQDTPPLGRGGDRGTLVTSYFSQKTGNPLNFPAKPRYIQEHRQIRRNILIISEALMRSARSNLLVPEVREVMDIRQASDYLGISPDTLYKYASEGFVPAFKLGNRWRFKRSRLDEWMDRQSEIQSGAVDVHPDQKKPVKPAM
jgi:excisionase family DNA binding protein